MMNEFDEILDTKTHLAILGGPGSGKTYFALSKANLICNSGLLGRYRQVLFLSFARSTIARIAEQAKKSMTAPNGNGIEINTYHGFMWNIIKAHGKLLGLKKEIRLLPPYESSYRLAGIPLELRQNAIHNLLENEGLLHFDLFAETANRLLFGSSRLRNIYCDSYPVIFLDEFQDTSTEEMSFIRTLASISRIVILGDPKQRIYDFRGADPKRISDFILEYHAKTIDLGTNNFRSSGKDIVAFGDAIFSDQAKGKTFNDVDIIKYNYYNGKHQMYPLKTSLLRILKRISSTNRNGWSIAVLVPTNKMMISASEYFSSSTDKLPPIYHEVMVDHDAVVLASLTIAALLDKSISVDCYCRSYLVCIRNYLQGRRGNKGCSVLDGKLIACIDAIIAGNTSAGSRSTDLRLILELPNQVHNKDFSGSPWDDWLAIRNILESSASKTLTALVSDAKNLRLLNRGTTLNNLLVQQVRSFGAYKDALVIVEDALVQDHFLASYDKPKGVVVMTMHKSKGKEYDEVIIFEDKYTRLIKESPDANSKNRDKMLVRVAVTRARQHATILTPQYSISELFS